MYLRVIHPKPLRLVWQVSPDGSKVAYLAPSDKDVLNVWVRSLAGGDDDRMITNDTLRGIRTYDWAEDSAHIMYLQVISFLCSSTLVCGVGGILVCHTLPLILCVSASLPQGQGQGREGGREGGRHKE
jgi:hypothetical protein